MGMTVEWPVCLEAFVSTRFLSVSGDWPDLVRGTAQLVNLDRGERPAEPPVGKQGGHSVPCCLLK